MFSYQFLRRCYAKRPYILPLLVMLNVVAGIYVGWADHSYTRHLFLFLDPVNSIANILFWLLLFLPIAALVIQEGGTFGISLFCRIPRARYMRKRSLALCLYCASFFALSMGVSFVVGLVSGGIGSLHHAASAQPLPQDPISAISLTRLAALYLVLILLGFDLLQLACCVGWAFRSSYAMTIVYAVIVTVAQIPGIQARFSLVSAMENVPLSILVLALCGLLFSLLAYGAMMRQDGVGLKKGVSI